MTRDNILYYIPSKGQFLKIQAGTGDALDEDDVSEGYTDYVLWNVFGIGTLGLDGELSVDCTDSGMILLKGDQSTGDTIKDVLSDAYGDETLEYVQLKSDQD